MSDEIQKDEQFIAQAAGMRCVYNADQTDHRLAIRIALDKLAAIRDYIDDTEPDDWQVAFEQIDAILSADERMRS